MTNGSNKDYRFPEKDEWVRVCWNHVLRRTKGREQEEAILYLAGPDDYDRMIAERRDVPPCNLIAIDRKKQNIDAVRKNGGLGICGDVVDVLRTWPARKPVCAIVLDLCQGFEKLEELQRIQCLQMQNTALSRAIIAINLQRGRDAESNKDRAFISEMVARHQKVRCEPSGDIRSDAIIQRYQELISGLSPLHRGLIFALWYVSVNMKSTSGYYFDKFLNLFNGNVGLCLMSILTEFLKPRFFSYKSSKGLVFDSVVIYPYSTFFEMDNGAENIQRVKDFIGVGRRKVALSTAATLAVRTRRSS